MLVHNADYDQKWHKGSFDSPEDSLRYHFDRHGAEINATTPEQYLNKAEQFKNNQKRAKSYPVDGANPGTKRYVKNGRYIDLAPDGRIVSFGSD
ncbi:hypothetical protein H6S82_12755 [Planktothrix sp. FACHB-1355]|uniref:Uncharacterized protein n=1 Tax=Aerosakkonema funiforme FACHB-1375 TaxID=2949571 RepID=A0A926VCK4_9CYAN|nr:hypothetical protein [Aerosakkonema funiforme]MBD2181095.1 hypothetical protein [Aerosakkonema funiforme FACHB-1375]MBD3559727.1 hypothetical protein [Planktothrix sp. FACHB-1355]